METEDLDRARIAKQELIKQLSSYGSGISIGLSQREENWVLCVRVSEEKARTCIPLIFLGFKVEKYITGKIVPLSTDTSKNKDIKKD